MFFLRSAAISETETLLHDEGGSHTAYFFCSFTDQCSQDPVNLFGSLLVQLCNKDVRLWPEVDARYRKEVDRGLARPIALGLAEIESMLDNALKMLPNVYFFLDALNESKNVALILSTIWNLTKGNPQLQLMLSSTEQLCITPAQLTQQSIHPVSMISRLVDEDIRIYVDFCLEKHERLCRLPLPLKQDIRSKLLRRADGT